MRRIFKTLSASVLLMGTFEVCANSVVIDFEGVAPPADGIFGFTFDNKYFEDGFAVGATMSL